MKILFSSIALLLLLFTSPSDVQASPRVAGHSAMLEMTHDSELDSESTLKTQAISRVLARHNSPMVQEAEHFVYTANKLNLDPYFLPAIAGVESGFGRVMIDGTHNPFGWNVGRTPFPTWSDGITTVATALRYKYIDKGADSLDAIGYRYAGGSTTWAPKVRTFIAQFEREEAKIRRYSML